MDSGSIIGRCGPGVLYERFLFVLVVSTSGDHTFQLGSDAGVDSWLRDVPREGSN